MIQTDERVLTYDELATAFGINRKNARQLVNQKRWNRSKGSDGRARIHVPAGALDEAHTPSDTSTSIASVTALTCRIERLEQDLAAAMLERDEARARATDLAIRAAQGEAFRKIIEAERCAAEQRAKRGFWARLWGS